MFLLGGVFLRNNSRATGIHPEPMNRRNLVVFSFLLFVISASGQQTASYAEPSYRFARALELFDRDKFAPAHRLFLDLARELDGSGSQFEANADFYAALCSIRLQNSDGAVLMEQFLLKHPTSSKSMQAHQALAIHYFSDAKWNQASSHFSLVDPLTLSSTETGEYFFKAGYTALQLKENGRASQYFNEIKNSHTSWGIKATYYYACIAYESKKLETALTEFRRIQQEADYEETVPYYIVQILYLQKKYGELLNEGKPLLAKAETSKKGSVALLLADAAYKTAAYPEALLYIEQYQKITNKPLTRDQNYLLAYSAYQTHDYPTALLAFQGVVSGRDSLSHNALYHIGDCYLKTGNKPMAQKSFYDAYQTAYNQSTKENALFNYAKLSYELASDPYNAAIKALQEYVSAYPDSPRTDEAWQYLVNLALVSKNYATALQALDKIKFQDIKIRTARQKVLYFYAIELFNARKYNEAIEYFTKASEFNFDKSLKPLSLYWAGEAAYRLGEFRSAIGWYNRFLISRGAYDMPEYAMAVYNSGYSWYKMKEYSEAILQFRKYLGSTAEKDPQMVADAQLRLADCFFITRNYSDAVVWYERVSRSASFDADYAFFQLALAKGVTKNFEGKTVALNQLLSQFPKSPLVDDAEYELAVTYLIMNQNEDALKHLQHLITQFPNSSFTSRAMLRRGLLLYNNGDNLQALQQLKQVISRYPGTPESREALQSISNIYVEMDDVQGYMTYVQGVPFARVPMARQDSLTYVVAENQYMRGDCAKATKGFTDYLDKNRQGVFAASAFYYRGDCLFKQGDQSSALPDFLAVADLPRSRFSENAIARAAAITYSGGHYPQALRLFDKLYKVADNKDNLLDATAGMMRCYFQTERYDSAILLATRLMSTDKVNADMLVEAHLLTAKSSMKINNLELAEREFRITSKLTQGEAAAEAIYMLAALAARRNDWKQAEKISFEVINNYSLYDYWRVKAFLLLADVYANTNNVFQARQTLQSIIENYEGEDLRNEAIQKLAALDAVGN